MRTPKSLALSALIVAALLLGACGGDDDSSEADGSAPTEASGGGAGGEVSDDDVTEALENAAPDETVEVPSEEGAVTIADYSSGASQVELADPSEVAQVLAIVGTDADGYITDDAIVVRAEQADAGLWCETFTRLGLSTYTFIPVLPDGTGVACG